MNDIDQIRRDNIKVLEKLAGGPAAMAKLVGMSDSQYSNLRDGAKDSKTGKRRGMRKETAWKFEDAGGKPRGWLDKIHESNTEPGSDILGHVPLISWVQAGSWSEIIDNFVVGDAEEWLPCPVKHSDRTFVLRVRGESMFNPHGRPSFQDGDLIFVDPDRDAIHGSLVVVRLDDAQEATFKRLVVEGERRYLRALNPAWPEQIIQINGNATICGVVIFKGEKL